MKPLIWPLGDTFFEPTRYYTEVKTRLDILDYSEYDTSIAL